MINTLNVVDTIGRLIGINDFLFFDNPGPVQYHINGSKENGMRAKDVKTYDPHTQRINEIYLEYEKQCQKEGVVDFGELLLKSYELLFNNEVYSLIIMSRSYFTHR